MQPLAKIELKTNIFGSSIEVKNVTPAQLLFLVADNHKGAGGDPIVRLEETDLQSEEDKAAKLEKEVEKFEKIIASISEDDTISQELQGSRIAAATKQLETRQSQLAELQELRVLRNLTPLQEKQRLAAKYGAKRVEMLYPGRAPSVPATFKEAREGGLTAAQPVERFLVEANGGYTS